MKIKDPLDEAVAQAVKESGGQDLFRVRFLPCLAFRAVASLQPPSLSLFTSFSRDSRLSPVQWTCIAKGKYLFEGADKTVFVRQVRNHVMVRTGGGWDTLTAWLAKLALQLSASPTKASASPRRRGQREAGKPSGLRQSSSSTSPSVNPPQAVRTKTRSKPELSTTPEAVGGGVSRKSPAARRSDDASARSGDRPALRRRAATESAIALPKAKAGSTSPRSRAASKSGKAPPAVKPRKKTYVV